MCTRSLHIMSSKLRANTFIPGVDRREMYVPCGHCIECNRAKSNEWTFRLKCEFDIAKANGGYAYFDTLTYNEDFLPKYGSFPCFCKSDVQKFFKRLRKACPSLEFKYFVTSEYGGRTHRPHYHILLIVYNSFSPLTLRQSVIKCWSEPYNNLHRFGFTDSMHPVSDNVVRDVRGLAYVAKYCCKDSEVMKSLECNMLTYKRIKDYLNIEHDLSYSDILKFQRYSDDCVIVRRGRFVRIQIFNFNLCSKGLGLPGLDLISEDNLFNDSISYETMNKKHPVQSMRIPMYFKRKLLYRYDKSSNRYILSDLGRLVRDSLAIKYVPNEVSDFNLITDFDVLCDVFNSVPSLQVYGSVSSLISRINSCLNGRSVKHFVTYCLFFKDRHVLKGFDDDDKLVNLDKDFMNSLLVRRDAIESYNSVFEYDESFGYAEGIKEGNYFYPCLYNNCLAFEGYDELYCILMDIRTAISHIRGEKEIEIEKQKKFIANIKHNTKFK